MTRFTARMRMACTVCLNLKRGYWRLRTEPLVDAVLSRSDDVALEENRDAVECAKSWDVRNPDPFEEWGAKSAKGNIDLLGPHSVLSLSRARAIASASGLSSITAWMTSLTSATLAVYARTRSTEVKSPGVKPWLRSSRGGIQ
jgi:hypothetical protein